MQNEDISVEDSLCAIEISRTETNYIIKMTVGDEPHRELIVSNFEEVLEQLVREIQEEFNLNP